MCYNYTMIGVKLRLIYCTDLRMLGISLRMWPKLQSKRKGVDCLRQMTTSYFKSPLGVHPFNHYCTCCPFYTINPGFPGVLHELPPPPLPPKCQLQDLQISPKHKTRMRCMQVHQQYPPKHPMAITSSSMTENGEPRTPTFQMKP